MNFDHNELGNIVNVIINLGDTTEKTCVYKFKNKIDINYETHSINGVNDKETMNKRQKDENKKKLNNNISS